jgi:hypothetical protein
MMMDSDREVHQGLCWFLRKARKKQQESKKLFLVKWKNTAQRLIFQNSMEKMPPEGEKKFRKEK